MAIILTDLLVAGFWLSSGPPDRPTYGLAVLPLTLSIVGVCVALLFALLTDQLPIVVLAVLAGGAMLVTGFTCIYYLIGPQYYLHSDVLKQHALMTFSVPMTRARALSFTMGTLSTAGGGITPVKRGAMYYVVVQNVMDLVYVVVVLGIVASKVQRTRG